MEGFKIIDSELIHTVIKIENPWNIESIYDLQYFNCQSCKFKNQSKQYFIDHVFEYHPEVVDYLSKIKDESLEDVICPWKITNFEDLDEDPLYDNNFRNILNLRHDRKIFFCCILPRNIVNV